MWALGDTWTSEYLDFINMVIFTFICQIKILFYRSKKIFKNYIYKEDKKENLRKKDTGKHGNENVRRKLEGKSCEKNLNSWEG